jgi:hypothetical protein
MVGADYPSLLIPTAVYGVFLVLLLVAASAFMVPSFMPTSRRVVRWQLKVGGSIFFPSFVAVVILPHVVGRSAIAALPLVPLLFGLMLFALGFSVWLYRLAVRCYVRGRIWQLQRKAASAEEAREAAAAYLWGLRAPYRRRRARRARRARARREALPATVVLLLWLGALLYILLVAYLGIAASTAARNAIEGRGDLYPGANLPAAVLLNVHVRPVRVDAIAPQFRPLQKAQVLYLGTNGAVYVLYNRTAREAVLVPTGSVALRFDAPG